MGALANTFGSPVSGGLPSVSPSSGASSGPQAGTTGNLVLNFGGINLGNQDIPNNASSVGGGASATGAPATVGAVPGAVSVIESYLPLLLIGAAVIAAVVYFRKKF